MKITYTLWNRWVRPRYEQPADGTHALYFGIGRITWRKEIKNDNADFLDEVRSDR